MQSEEITAWLTKQLPPELQIAEPEIRGYDDELVIVLTIDEAEESGAAITRQRELSRGLRMQLANELQARLGLPVSWGMRSGDQEVLFTTRTAPVMTRLGRAERDVLDTLVAAGVADTRSSALAYVVRAFAIEHQTWLGEIRQAIAEVQRVRSRLRVKPRRGKPPA